MIEVITRSVDDTKALAQLVGRTLKGGEVFELVSDVGGGKTAFVKGLALGLGIAEVVQSPTFTISRIYKARDGIELHHFDFYRLHDAGVMAAELAESLEQPNAVVAIEWGEIVRDIVPKANVEVKITAIDETVRRIHFEVPAKQEYIKRAITMYKESKTLA